MKLIRSPRGFHVHATKESRFGGLRSVCDTGPAVITAEMFEGSKEDVTCPLCQKRLSQLRSTT